MTPRGITLADMARGQGLTPEGWTEAERLAWYDQLATAGADESVLQRAVWVTLGTGPDPVTALERLLGVVRMCAPFQPDPLGADGWRAALRTFIEGGDCEDLSVLLVAFVRAARSIYRLPVYARLVWIRQPGRTLDHVTTEVAISPEALDESPVMVTADGPLDPRTPWQWAEPSVPGARLGEDPYAALLRAKAFAHGALVFGVARGGGA